jgi:hypothetical protein
MEQDGLRRIVARALAPNERVDVRVRRGERPRGRRDGAPAERRRRELLGGRHERISAPEERRIKGAHGGGEGEGLEPEDTGHRQVRLRLRRLQRRQLASEPALANELFSGRPAQLGQSSLDGTLHRRSTLADEAFDRGGGGSGGRSGGRRARDGGRRAPAVEHGMQELKGVEEQNSLLWRR